MEILIDPLERIVVTKYHTTTKPHKKGPKIDFNKFTVFISIRRDSQLRSKYIYIYDG